MTTIKAGPRLLEILRVEMYEAEGQFLYRIVSGGRAYHGFESTQDALDARHLFKKERKEKS